MQHTQDVQPLRDTTCHQQQQQFFSSWAESKRYTVLELIGKGSYGVVCAAKDNLTGERVAIKRISNVFEVRALISSTHCALIVAPAR